MIMFLWQAITKMYVRFLEMKEYWADDEKSPPDWADPILWKRSLM